MDRKGRREITKDIRKAATEILGTKTNEYFIEDTFENRGKQYKEFLSTLVLKLIRVSLGWMSFCLE